MKQAYGENRIKRQGILLALAAAGLYALGTPLSKWLLIDVPSVLAAGFLYVGAGIGMGVLFLLSALFKKAEREKPACLTRADWPYTVAMIVLDIAAPICLLVGLRSSSAACASLLGNFEIVATALFARLLFREKISKRLGLAIGVITLSCMFLSVEDGESFGESLRFGQGALWVLAAGAFWGLENNCTRRISDKDPRQTVLLKGVFSGGSSLLIGFLLGERIQRIGAVFGLLFVGMFAYGMSILVYILAQRRIGAARTGVYYAAAPFVASLLSLCLFRELPPVTFWIGLGGMGIGAVLASRDG